MTNRQTKRGSPSHVIREMQIKASEGWCHDLAGWPNPEQGQHQMLGVVKRSEISHTLARVQNGAATLGDSLAVSYEAKHTLITWSSNHTSWYAPKRSADLGLHKTCTWMFGVALYIFAKTQTLSKYPLVGEWINKLIHPENRILFSTNKK